MGKTVEVTELCFGAYPLVRCKELPLEEATAVLCAALEGDQLYRYGANYKTYAPIREALKQTKSTRLLRQSLPPQPTRDETAIEEALNELNLDEIDIFHLHAARVGEDVFTKRQGALECLYENKHRGRIKAVGISTHSVKVTARAATVEGIDVVFPLINKSGRGILDGSREEMEIAISHCVAQGKGVYLMKVLAGGTLVGDYAQAVEYARAIPGNASIAVGMVSKPKSNTTWPISRP